MENANLEQRFISLIFIACPEDASASAAQGLSTRLHFDPSGRKREAKSGLLTQT
jgi:hypothetical protein